MEVITTDYLNVCNQYFVEYTRKTFICETYLTLEYTCQRENKRICRDKCKHQNYSQLFYRKNLKHFEFIVLNGLTYVESCFPCYLMDNLVIAITDSSLLTPRGKFKNKSIPLNY